MTRKYRVASLAIISKIPGILGPGFLDITAKKMINENTRKSDLSVSSAGSVPVLDFGVVRHTKEERDACGYNL
jgi:hypothetical protein